MQICAKADLNLQLFQPGAGSQQVDRVIDILRSTIHKLDAFYLFSTCLRTRSQEPIQMTEVCEVKCVSVVIKVAGFMRDGPTRL